MSISQLSGLPGPYLYRWVRPLGVLLWAAALWPLGRAAVAEWRRRRAAGSPWRLAGSVATSLAVGALAVGVAAGEVSTPFEEYRERYRQTAIVATRAVDAIRGRRPSGPVEVRYTGGAVFTVAAVIGELERAGYTVTNDAGQGTVWGTHRLPSRDEPLVMFVTDELDALPGDPSFRRVATVDKLTPEQRRSYRAVTVSIERCAELARATYVGEPLQASPAEVEGCRRRAVLGPLDGTTYVSLGSRT